MSWALFQLYVANEDKTVLLNNLKKLSLARKETLVKLEPAKME